MRRLARLSLFLLLVPGSALAAEGDLVLRRTDDRDAPVKVLPAIAVKAFPYEGEPSGIFLDGEEIAVRYEKSVVWFDRETNRAVRRKVLFGGEPPARLTPLPLSWDPDGLVGPGLANSGEDREDVVVATATFGGREWRAFHPGGFFGKVDRPRSRRASWTELLRKFSTGSGLVARSASGEERGYSRAVGLPGGIVTWLAVADGTLWAACVDIYDPVADAWTQGGLARYDPGADRFVPVETIDGRPARFVTALQAVGDDLWVGFREGDGVAGDQVTFGMGLYPGDYRPEATAIVVARLSEGAWRTWARPPLPIVKPRVPPGKFPPSETPRALAVAGDRVVLFSTTTGHASGNWRVERDGRVWLLDPAKEGDEAWTPLDDLGDLRLIAMHAGGGEVVVRGMRGAYRYDPASRGFVFLDPKSPLRSPEPGAAAVAGDEFWFGMTNQAFGVMGRQGVYRWDERASEGRWFRPDEIGTGCPVARLLPDGEGGVWAWFLSRSWFGAAVEFTKYEEHPGPCDHGVGRYRDGEWEFPVEEYPEALKDVAEWPIPGSGRPVGARDAGPRRPGLDRWLPPERHRRTWVRIPGIGGGVWEVGPMDGAKHWAVPTPRAVWLLSRGLVVRLDRVWLEAILEDDGTPPEAALLTDPVDLERVRELLERQEHTEGSLKELLSQIRTDPVTMERAVVALLARAERPKPILRGLTLLRVLAITEGEKFTRDWWRWKQLLVWAYRRYTEITGDRVGAANAQKLLDDWRTLGVLADGLENPFR